MSVTLRDKLFFICQGFLKYNAFDFGVRLRSLLYKPFFRKFGKNIQIQDGVTFKYPSEITLGDNIKIGQNCFFVGKGGLWIGDNNMIGAGSKIITSKHNTQDLQIPMIAQGLIYESVYIGDDVWLGFDVKVFGGANIGRGSIVGTNSLVRNKFGSFSVLGGTPAIVLKSRIVEK